MAYRCLWCDRTEETDLLLPHWVHNARGGDNCGFFLLCDECKKRRIAEGLGRHADCLRCQEVEKETTPEPLRGSATLHGGLSGRIEATARLGPLPKPPKPPWQWFIDQNSKAAKWLLKVLWWLGFGGLQAIWDIVQPFLGRRSLPGKKVGPHHNLRDALTGPAT